MAAILKPPTIQAAAPPPPPPPPPPPTLSGAVDRVRDARASADAQARKRGYASNIKTGPQGVGPNATPLGVKTLFGS